MVFASSQAYETFKISINTYYVIKILEEVLDSKFSIPSWWTKETANLLFYDYMVYIEKEYNYYVNEQTENHQCFVDWFLSDDNYSAFVRWLYVKELFHKNKS